MSSFEFETKEVEAGGKLYHVKELTVGQRRELFAQYKEDEDAGLMSANLVLMSCEEMKGKTLNDVFAMPGKVYDKIQAAAAEVSGMEADSDSGNESGAV